MAYWGVVGKQVANVTAARSQRASLSIQSTHTLNWSCTMISLCVCVCVCVCMCASLAKCYREKSGNAGNKFHFKVLCDK